MFIIIILLLAVVAGVIIYNDNKKINNHQEIANDFNKKEVIIDETEAQNEFSMKENKASVETGHLTEHIAEVVVKKPPRKRKKE